MIFTAFFFVGGAFKYLLKLSNKLNNILIGSSVSFGALFLLSFMLVIYQRSYQELFIILALFFVIFITFGILKTKVKIELYSILFIFAYILLFVLLSTKMTIGEQMGDSVFYFQEASLNIHNPILQSFFSTNGFIFKHQVITNDMFFTFYFFFSYVDDLAIQLSQLFNLITYPYYVYTMWIANGLFFGLLGLIILNLINYFDVKFIVLKINLFSFLSLIIGTYYFNLSLAHIGNTFLYAFLSFGFFVIYDYLQNKNTGNLVLLSLILYAIISSANVGVIISFYLAFGLFVVSLLFKDKNAFIMLSLLFIPVIHYLFLLAPLDGALASLPFLTKLSNLPLVIILLLGVSILFYKNEKWHAHLFRLSYLVMLIILIGLLYLNITKVDNYWERVLEFSSVKANFDRVQDYFTFNTLSLSLINLIHYGLLISLCFIKETRKLGLILVVLLLFFINPLMYPFIYDKILWLYNRAYFVLFNYVTLGLGIIVFHQTIASKKYKHSNLMFIAFNLISIYYMYLNFSEPVSPIYIPSENFNPVYKLPQDQVDILNETKQIIEIEQIDTPRVVSQIYATLYYLEKIDNISFNTALRRGLYYADSYDELNQIFYTPIFTGDDGLRLSAPVKKTCQILMDAQVDFVIYDKSLSVYDTEVEDWIPTYWYARDCYTKTYENDRYILYRFFWD